MPRVLQPQISSALQQGVPLLVPNQRLKRYCLQLYQQHQYHTTKHQACLQPAINTIGEWLESTWLEHHLGSPNGPANTLLADDQSLFIWQRIIQESDQGPALLNPDELAQTAQSAYQSLLLWRQTVEQLQTDYFSDSNTQAFCAWATAFETHLHNQQLITREQSYQQLLTQQAIPNLKHILLYGFDDVAPLISALLEQSGAEMTRIEHLIEEENTSTENASQPTKRRTQADSHEDEYLAAALWAKQQLSANPGQHVGIIHVNLGQHRQELERAFTEVFEPQYLSPATERYTLPFDFSAGTPLAQAPIIKDALQLLQLNFNRLPIAQLLQLLQSPFWGNHVFLRNSAFTLHGTPKDDSATSLEEPVKGSVNSTAIDPLALIVNLQTQLRHLGQFDIKVSDFRQRCRKEEEKLAAVVATETETISSDFIETPTCSRLSEKLQAFADKHRRQASRQSPSRWAGHFVEQLHGLNWPGPRALDSHEHQQVKQFYEVIEQLSNLDQLQQPLSAREAIKALAKLLANTHFQAQTPASPISILGALEGAALHFDHCWVMGLESNQWPPSASPNPLLPLALQRLLNMPHASADRELHYAKTLTQQFLRCAPHTVMSFAADPELSDASISSLLQKLPKVALNELVDIQSSPIKVWKQQQHQPQMLCKQSDTGASTHRHWLQTQGGSAIFQLQAQCPFMAFAQLQLGIREPLPPSLGLNAIERGTLLHDALEYLWKPLQSQQQLIDLTDESLQQCIHNAIEGALAPWLERRQDLGYRYFKLEAQRLQALLNQWLEQEKQRPPFFIEGLEQKVELSLWGIDLTLRLDRLDRTDNNELILIDYKTGSPALNSLANVPPAEPQLPLYAVSLQQESNNNEQQSSVCAVAFAQINIKKQAMLGFGELQSTITGIQSPENYRQQSLPNWQELVQRWQSSLAQLAHSFLEGEASIEFLNPQIQQRHHYFAPLHRYQDREAIEQLVQAAASGVQS